MSTTVDNVRTDEASGWGGERDLLDFLVPVLLHWRLLVVVPLLAGLGALAVTYLVAPTFTSRTTFLPPQQQQSSTASALAQLTALTGLAGASTAVRTPGDQYVALLQTQTVADRIIDAFDLMRVYEVRYRFEARKALADRVRTSLGRKDGLITVEVDDNDPQRAADIANRHVDELRRLTNSLALTEAQQRRLFLEGQLAQTRERLAQAQRALQGSGFNQGALRADARSAAELYARLRAEVTAAEIRLQALRSSLADSTPEVQQAVVALQGLRTQLMRAESGVQSEGPDYIGKFREFKYQETLFDLFARQYELARVDESREGALVQVVDVATPAEWKSKPKRALAALTATLATLLVLLVAVQVHHALQRSSRPGLGERLRAARSA